MKELSIIQSCNRAVPGERIATDGLICFFGFGELMRSCFDQLVLAFGRSPDIISDNDPELWGMWFRGIEVVPPSQLNSHTPAIRVVITIGKYEPIYAQLIDAGISKVYVAEYKRSLFRLEGLKQVQAGLSHLKDKRPEDNGLEALCGKFAVVTGASKGLGFQIAMALADAGVNLLLHGRSEDSLKNITSYCTGKGVKVEAIPADLGDTRAVEFLGKLITNRLHHIDILVNNAAVSPPADIEGFPYISTELYELCFRVNALAPIMLSNAILPEMIKRGYGRIVNITSSISEKPHAMHYGCSKASLDKYVVDLHKSLNGSGVSISSVDPGWLRTPMTDFKGRYDPTSAINGVLLPIILELNGCWISAQDFSLMTLQSAVMKARDIFCKRSGATIELAQRSLVKDA